MANRGFRPRSRTRQPACELQVDVGFGDAVTPEPEKHVFPGLLDFPEPEVKTYLPETTITEQLHGLVRFGREILG